MKFVVKYQAAGKTKELGPYATLAEADKALRQALIRWDDIHNIRIAETTK